MARDRDDTLSMTVSEERWRRPPTNGDYKQVERNLYDFNIVVTIPRFDSFRALQAWQRRQIDYVLM